MLSKKPEKKLGVGEWGQIETSDIFCCELAKTKFI
jgi:hypothetical protein